MYITINLKHLGCSRSLYVKGLYCQLDWLGKHLELKTSEYFCDQDILQALTQPVNESLDGIYNMMGILETVKVGGRFIWRN